MHEYSIVQALLEQIENIAEENKATKVTKIITKLGAMSAIEPHLLEVAFDTFKEKTIADSAEFVMNIQPLTIRCKECGAVSEIEKTHYTCLQCGSVDIEVIDGEDMYLMSLEME